MLFSSPIFLFLFLPLVILGYFLSPKFLKNLFLILASALFYAWGEGQYLFYIFLVIGANFLFGKLIQRQKGKKLFLLLGVVFNLAFLFYFKYLLFFFLTFSKVVPSVVSFIKLPDSVHMPLGVSFVTFHLVSYLFDIYRQKLKAEKNILNFALYILLFPHLIAGPILRYVDLVPMIKKRLVNFESLSSGFERFVLGLAKKVIIANNMGLLADRIFNLYPHQVSTEIVWLGVVAYTLQIFFDFSGYSDMAIGLAKMFGFKFAENFNYPYISASIQEFWRRWHMTLFLWFRDYVYIPLGGNRLGILRTTFNLSFVFFLTGLWHGASWNFVFWGLYHGFFMILERIVFKDRFEAFWKPARHVYTLLVVMTGWMFFRVESLSYGFYLFKVMYGLSGSYSTFPVEMFLNLETLFILLLGILFSLPLKDLLFKQKNLANLAPRLSWASGLAVGLLFLYCAMELVSGTYNPFIYFRF